MADRDADRASDAVLLRSLFDAALEAAGPDGKFDGCLPAPPRGRTIVVGAGKASARMAQAFEAACPFPVEGLVVTRYGHAVPTRSVAVVEAAHPVPDAAGAAAARRILDLVGSATADDLVVALISGGASSLLALPAPGLTLADKQAVNRALLRSGAPIAVMNTVRKAMSAIKGGRLAAAALPARLVTYVISDVAGDDPATIGSGPTIPAMPDPEAALTLMARYGVPVPPAVATAIRANMAALGDGPVAAEVHVIATPAMALAAAASAAERAGITPFVIGDAVEGEAADVARDMAAMVRSVLSAGMPAAAPCVLLSGGETTVKMAGREGGRGGRNTTFLLALALALDGLPGVSAIACDTDGIDGSENNAGAWIDDTILEQARKQGLDLASHLAGHDAYAAFASLDRLVVTGPTLTNVNDFRAILVRRPR